MVLKVIGDSGARYFGTELTDQSLPPDDNPRIGSTRFEDRISRFMSQK
jgi:hypothetical protein